MNTQHLTTMLGIMPLLALSLVACTPVVWVIPAPTYSPAPPFTGAPLLDANYSADSAAQATLAAGQNEIANLAYQSTLVSRDMEQAAQAAAQTTLDYNQHRLMELSIQGTEVSQNMARAAATQQFFAAQTQAVWDATSSAQNQAATATYAAYNLHVTQTAQAQAQVNAQSTQVAQWSADQRIYELTATPWAAAQAEIAQDQNESERKSWWEDFILNPLRAILFTLVILVLLAGAVVAYLRLLPVLEMRLRTMALSNDAPVVLLEGSSADAASYPARFQLPSEIGPTVEVVGPTEPSIVNWITEAEQKLRSDDGMQS